MIIFFNPISTSPGKQPLPLSVLSLAAVLDPAEDWYLVDGNVDADPAARILELAGGATRGELIVLAATVMPGPQVAQAVTVSRHVREANPDVAIVWGGYFPTQHADIVLAATYVDYVVRAQGEQPFLRLLKVLKGGGSLSDVPGLSWRNGSAVTHNATAPLTPVDDLPDLPYERLAMDRYLHANYLGRRTVAHNSSYGCPFACAFCAVVAMAQRRWVAQSPARMHSTLSRLAKDYRVDAVQMHDMDFFISESRAVEFAERITPLGLHWWALGRVDLLSGYSDASWRTLARSGLKMVFSGAESGSDSQLSVMHKGGRASTECTRTLVRRLREFGVVPELSFVLGTPPDPLADLNDTLQFIRSLKRINPATEIVLYTYTPVPGDGAMLREAAAADFTFPQTLDEWASPAWEQTSMRRGDGLPWITRQVRRRARNFERVLNAYYPTVTNARMGAGARAVLRGASAWRYLLQWYAAPYELRALHRLIRYQRPETTGF
jgi:anaerobic magnesium-protoporphyrin IX monomethyl ester cyclase